jgi:hypothetical protein
VNTASQMASGQRKLNRHDARWMVELTEVANYFAFLSGMVNPFEVPAPPRRGQAPDLAPTL